MNFDTLKQDANGVYEKYTLEFWCKSKALSRVIVKVGNQVKTSDTISNIAFEKVVFNFQSNALVSNQPIQIYLNQADTVYLDDVSLTKGWDYLISGFFKSDTALGASQTYFDKSNSLGSYSSIGYGLYRSPTNQYYDHLSLSINSGIEVGRGSAPNTTLYEGTFIKVNRKDSLEWYCNGIKLSFTSAINLGGAYLGNANTSAGFYIGTSASAGKFKGKIGHLQLVKFTDISQSNVNSTTLTTAYNRGKLIQNEWTGGSPVEVAFYDWKGSTTNEILSDKSSMGNNLTGTNIDINDRIKVKGKFK